MSTISGGKIMVHESEGGRAGSDVLPPKSRSEMAL